MILEINWLHKDYSIGGYSDYEKGLLRVFAGDLCGIIDLEHKVVIPPVYHYIEHFKQGLAKVSKDGIFSYIDRQNHVVISSKDYFVSSFKAMSDNGLITVGTMNGEARKWGFVDLTGNIVVPLEYEDVNLFSHNLASVKKNGLYGYVDTEGKVVIPLIYDSVKSFENGIACITIDKKYGVIDINGNAVLEPKYDHISIYWDGIIAVQQDEKWGIFDKKGKQIVPFIYDSFHAYNCDGYAEVGQNGKCGLIDQNGKLVVPLEYESVSFFNDDGYAEASLGKRKKVLIGHDGKILKGFSNLLFGFTEGLAAVKKKGKWGYIDRTGVEIIPPQYADVTGFSNGLARVMDRNGKCGFIDKQNNAVIAFIYDWTYTFNGKNHTGVVNGFNPIFHPPGPRKEGLIDRKGSILLPVVYDDVIKVEKDNLVFVRQGRQWGYAFVPESI